MKVWREKEITDGAYINTLESQILIIHGHVQKWVDQMTWDLEGGLRPVVGEIIKNRKKEGEK